MRQPASKSQGAPAVAVQRMVRLIGEYRLKFPERGGEPYLIQKRAVNGRWETQCRSQTQAFAKQWIQSRQTVPVALKTHTANAGTVQPNV